MIKIPVSLGELYDKITILEIKVQNLNDPVKAKNALKELLLLKKIAEDHPIDPSYKAELYGINLNLWVIEDRIRALEEEKRFDDEFLETARSVYICNDDRSNIKRTINIEYKSELIEEKSHD